MKKFNLFSILAVLMTVNCQIGAFVGVDVRIVIAQGLTAVVAAVLAVLDAS